MPVGRKVTKWSSACSFSLSMKHNIYSISADGKQDKEGFDDTAEITSAMLTFNCS